MPLTLFKLNNQRSFICAFIDPIKHYKISASLESTNKTAINNILKETKKEVNIVLEPKRNHENCPLNLRVIRIYYCFLFTATYGFINKAKIYRLTLNV